MIHKIKALHDEARGLSIRATSQELGLARNTVRGYLRRGTQEIAEQRLDTSRQHRLFTFLGIPHLSPLGAPDSLGL